MNFERLYFEYKLNCNRKNYTVRFQHHPKFLFH